MTTEESTVRLKCPACGRQGHAVWREAVLGAPRHIEGLSAGFLSVDAGASEGPRILCQTCRASPDAIAGIETNAP